MFSYEKLNVYNESLDFVADLESITLNWESKHVFIDHLNRASESILINLAEGCRSNYIKEKQLSVDYSIGSVLEFSACFDIAMINMYRK